MEVSESNSKSRDKSSTFMQLEGSFSFLPCPAEWHLACTREDVAVLGKKRWGKRFFEIVLAELAQSGIRGAPSSDPLIFVDESSPTDLSSQKLQLLLTPRPQGAGMILHLDK
jgi:hypothetical protein